MCLEGYEGDMCQILKKPLTCQHPDMKTCDQRCNNEECSFCGGSCSLGIPSPWEFCPTENDCATLFDNGVCDDQCSSENCLFDGRDCEPQQQMQQCPFEEYCRKSYNNGKCDEGCNRAECAWDGLDCDRDSNPDLALGEIMLVVDLEIHLIRGNSTYRNEMLRTLSIILHTNLVVAVDKDGQLKIEEVPADANSYSFNSDRYYFID